MITMLRWAEESTNSQVVIDLIHVNFTRKVMEKLKHIFCLMTVDVHVTMNVGILI